MVYNISTASNATSIYDFFSNVNTSSEGSFGVIIIFAVFLIIYGISKNYDTITALITSTFSTSIIASLMFFLGVINWGVAIIPFAIFITLLLYKVISS